MPTVKLDTIKDAGLSVTKDRIQLKRSATVSALATASTLALVEAYALLPQYGDFYPDRDDFRVVDVDVRPIGPRVAEAVIVYEVPDLTGGATPYVYEFTTAVVSEETTYDKDGGLITVEFTYTDADGAEQTDEQHPIVRVMKPMSVLRATRREPGPINPAVKTHVGSVNSATWATGDKYTWLCTAISMISRDKGATYETTYEFTHKPDGWYGYAFYFDPRGKIPKVVADTWDQEADVGEYNGWTKVAPYAELNFGGTFGNP